MCFPPEVQQNTPIITHVDAVCANKWVDSGNNIRERLETIFGNNRNMIREQINRLFGKEPMNIGFLLSHAHRHGGDNRAARHMQPNGGVSGAKLDDHPLTPGRRTGRQQFLPKYNVLTECLAESFSVFPIGILTEGFSIIRIREGGARHDSGRIGCGEWYGFPLMVQIPLHAKYERDAKDGQPYQCF